MKKTITIIHLAIAAIYVVFAELAYSFVAARTTVFVFGIIAMLSVFASLILTFISIHKDITPYGIIIIEVVALFRFDEYLPAYQFGTTAIYICLVIAIFLSLISVIIIYKRSTYAFYIYILFFLVLAFLFFVFTSGQVNFMNYSFDMNSSKDLQYVVISKNPELEKMIDRQAPTLDIGGSGYFYKIKCIDDYDGYTLTEIQIEESFDVKVDSIIIIRQFKGVFYETYRLDFDSLNSAMQ